MAQEFIIPEKQRGLVFQGGGSLAAYEAGVFQALYENITKEDERKAGGKEEEIDRPLFDIVPGTSIGAINASILISFKEDRRYQGLLEGTFSIDKIVIIERKNDSDTISNKHLTLRQGKTIESQNLRAAA
jgi:predicted acylesterase/phospholipase RssA